MKTRTVKLLAAAIIAGNVMMGGTVSTLAEEATETAATEKADAQEAVTSEKTEVQETAASLDESYLYGAWQVKDGGRVLFTPAGQMYQLDVVNYVPYCTYEIEGTKIKFDLETLPSEDREELEEMGGSISVELKTIEESDPEPGDDFTEDKYYTETGKDGMLVLKVQYTDNSDPLSPAETENVTYAYKQKYMTDYLLRLFENSTWEMNGNILDIKGQEGLFNLPMSLNDGEQTGVITTHADGKVIFDWEGGSRVEYNYVTADANSVTLAAAEDEGKTFVFTKVNEAASEDAAMEEGATEMPQE